MRQRWYDFDPVISLAVNLIEQADEKTKKHCLNYIIKRATDYGIELETKLDEQFDMLWQRRTDSTSHFFEAMEYFKKADTGFQKEISMSVIEYVQNLDKKLED